MANVFSKLKQIKDLRNQAKELQGALGNESISAEYDGVIVAVNPSFEVTDVKIEKDLTKEQLAKAFQKATNEAVKKTQKVVAQKIQAMGGLSKFGGSN